MKRPHQRCEMTLTLGASSLAELVRKIEQVAVELSLGNEDDPRRWVSSHLGILSIEVDPSVTKESYETAVTAFVAHIRAERAKESTQ